MSLAVSFADVAQSVALGVALAMDAMAVTLSNTLCEPDMPRSKKYAMPVLFALFQMGMPIAGFLGGMLVAPLIEAYAGIVSFAILAFVGGKMLVEAVRELREPEACAPTRAFVGGKMLVEAVRELREPEACAPTRLTWGELAMESVATSIDAFVVGVSLAASGANIALYGGMIGITTFACCLFVLQLGKRLGERFGAHAQVAGGVVLVLIGLKALLG